MVELLRINERNFFYQKYDTTAVWTKRLPNENWLLFAIVANREKEELDEISKKLIENNTCYVCCAGEQGELLHDYVDDEIVIRRLGMGDKYLPPFDISEIMTTWHHTIQDGLWFSAKAAIMIL